jgi:parallel beta-helix repeat protein
MRIASLALAAAALCGPVGARTLEVAAGPDAGERIQSALLDAKAGDTVSLGAGVFDLTDGLSLDASGVTIRGAGAGKTILAFDGQKGGAEGLLITGNKTVIRGLTVRNPKGNGIKAKGVDQFSVLDVDVFWSGGPKSTNGAYGIYPVSSSHILIARSHAAGASDTGIYVGQSHDIIVQNNHVDHNVSGIEIENCFNAEVKENLSDHNTGGVLVFDLPDLPQIGGHATQVYHNKIADNDTPNFAPEGNIVGKVPMGTGVMIMANRDVAVYQNDIENNGSGALLLVAYLNAFTDARYNPLPREVAIYQNKLVHNGFAPAFPGGNELAAAFGGSLPPIIYDGVHQFTHPGGATETDPGVMAISDGPVLNLNLKVQGTSTDKAQPTKSGSLNNGAVAAPPHVVLPAEQMALLKE